MSTVPESLDRLKPALADRYTIERELGRGGMAVVYLAHDHKLGRPVALKVLRPELAASIGAERFLREIEIAANLTHPNILALHDCGEANGLLYYVMPYVEGESLSERLNREIQLPLEEALQITREVADALDHAHSLGIVHRDIKPENILFEAGHAVVADFGIARAVTEAGGEKLTETGIAVGTPAYMSPEQAAGEQEPDSRTDIYALGCVLYEMLGGEPPYTGPSAQAILARKSLEPVPPLHHLRETITPDVEQAVTRALAKTPADRFATASQFAEALVVVETAQGAGKRPVLGAARRWRNAIAYSGIAILAAIGAYVIISRTVGPSEVTVAAGPPKLAVLPFANLGSAEDEYFADGITDEITSRIAQISGLHIISRTSAIQYQNHDKTLRQIGEELSVDYVLVGTIRTDRAPDGSGQVRVTPQLIRISDDANLWTDRYTSDLLLGEIFRIQEQIANQVAEALDVTLLEPERRALASRPTESMEAYEYYRQGNDHLLRTFTRADWGEAERLYEKAVDLDPDFALAYAQLSYAQSGLYWQGLGPALLVSAKEAVERAFALQPDLPEAHVALALYHYFGSRDYTSAIRQLAIALEHQPNNSTAISMMGAVQRRQGDWTEAVANFKRALALDPRSADRARDVGETLRIMRQYEEAEQYYDRAISLSPDWGFLYLSMASLHLERDADTDQAARALREGADRTYLVETSDRLLRILGNEYLESVGERRLARDTAAYFLSRAWRARQRGQAHLAQAFFDSTRVVLEARVRVNPDYGLLRRRLGLTYAALGRKDAAIREATKAVELMPVSLDALEGPGLIIGLAEVYVMVGEYDAAIDQFDYLLSIPSFISVPWLRVDPLYHPLRDHPRFQTLLDTYDN